MFQKTLVQEISIRTNLSDTEIEPILNAFSTIIKTAILNREPVELPGLGTFHVHHLASLKELDPDTGKMVMFPPKDTLEFTPAG